MPYTVASATTAVRQLLNESVTSFWTDAEISEWLAQATLDISTTTRCLERTATITVSNGDWDYTLPSGIIDTMSVVWLPTLQPLRKTNAVMLASESGPDVEADRPTEWFEWNGVLYISRRPNATAHGNDLLVFYALASNDFTLLSDLYQLLAIHYAAYRGKLKDKRYAEAGLLYAEYANGIGIRKLDIQQRVPHSEADLILPMSTVER